MIIIHKFSIALFPANNSLQADNKFSSVQDRIYALGKLRTSPVSPNYVPSGVDFETVPMFI